MRDIEEFFALPNIRICFGNCSFTRAVRFSNGASFNETRLATADTPLSVRAAR